MDDKKSEGISNIYSAIGGALLGMAIVDQVTKTIAPTIKKLSSGEPIEGLKLLPGEQEQGKDKDDESQNEISELKHMISELEEKAKSQQGKQEG